MGPTVCQIRQERDRCWAIENGICLGEELASFALLCYTTDKDVFGLWLVFGIWGSPFPPFTTYALTF